MRWLRNQGTVYSSIPAFGVAEDDERKLRKKGTCVSGD